jgi:hypothetical protein
MNEHNESIELAVFIDEKQKFVVLLFAGWLSINIFSPQLNSFHSHELILNEFQNLVKNERTFCILRLFIESLLGVTQHAFFMFKFFAQRSHQLHDKSARVENLSAVN